jgi:hypothetical protein
MEEARVTLSSIVILHCAQSLTPHSTQQATDNYQPNSHNGDRRSVGGPGRSPEDPLDTHTQHTLWLTPAFLGEGGRVGSWHGHGGVAPLFVAQASPFGLWPLGGVACSDVYGC